MSIHTAMTRITAAGDRPQLIPEAEDGPLSDAVHRVIDQLAPEEAGTVFVHIWWGEIAPCVKDLFRFVGHRDACLSALHEKWPNITIELPESE